MPRIHAASRPVTTGFFCHSCPTRSTSASSLVPVGMPLSAQKQRWIVPLHAGPRVHCAPVSPAALCSCGSAVPGHGATESSRAPVLFPPLPGASAPPALITALVVCSLSTGAGGPFQRVRRNISPSVLPQDLPSGNGVAFFLEEFSAWETLGRPPRDPCERPLCQSPQLPSSPCPGLSTGHKPQEGKAEAAEPAQGPELQHQEL